MAVIRNTAAMQYRGKVGNTTYYVEGGRQLARVSQNSSNYGETASRSESQQFQRGKWGNLVNFYKVSKGWMRKAFESKKRNQSDYNRFMQLNTPSAKVYLTKNMYANGGCVVDEFRISEGSLRPIQVHLSGSKYVTNLSLGPQDITDDTTVEDFSHYLVNANSHLHEGIQISFISYQQTVSPDGVPSLICTAYEVTLDFTNQLPIRNYLPVFCSSTTDGYLSTNNDISVGAFAYVLSETREGKTSVSTQSLITKNAELIDAFTSPDAIKRSIDSYGVDDDIFLTSGSYSMSPTEQPVFLSMLVINAGDTDEITLMAGMDGPYVDDMWVASKNPLLVVDGSYATIDRIEIIFDDDSKHGLSYAKMADGRISLIAKPSYSTNMRCKSISAVLDGKTYSIRFVTL